MNSHESAKVVPGGGEDELVLRVLGVGGSVAFGGMLGEEKKRRNLGFPRSELGPAVSF